MNVLLAIDLGDTTRATVDAVHLLGPSHDLWLLHVAEPDPEFVGWDAGPDSIRQSVADHYRDEHTALRTVAERLRDDGYRCTPLLVQGRFAETILDQAERLSEDLIFMGTHGKGLARKLCCG
jgi:nucleotide-binding universal stress UspA family protein